MAKNSQPRPIPAALSTPWARWGLSGPGLLLGAAWVVASMSPSLLPRTWYLQGVVMGVCAAGGYVVGKVLRRVARWVGDLLDLRVSIGARQRHVLGVVTPVLLALAFAWATIANIRSQAVTATAVRLTPLSPLEWVGALALLVLLFAGQLALGRLLVAWGRQVRSRARRHTSRAIATALSVTLVLLVTAVFTDVLIVRPVAQAIGRSAAAADQSTPAGRTAPASGLRSGGPGSSEPWDSLGFEGQRFVTGAPAVTDLSAGLGRAAADVKNPIRVYASLHHHDDDLTATADAVVAELRRTGGFERSVLAVFTTTGTGWVNEWSTQSVEYLTGGDSAIASMQYSDLPSPVALVTDRVTPREAGKALFDAVYAAWSALPADRRPQLVVSGESLGVYGGTGAFDSVDDLLARAQGGVWSGGPSFTPLISTLMRERTPGSPQILPVIDSGRHIRFSAGGRGLNADINDRAYAPWQSPRFVVVQHPSDPIVWWTPSTLSEQPDWLREAPGPDVNPGMRWYPFVTFWQLASDMAVGLSPPAGYGHRYGAQDLLPAWESVLQRMPPDRDRLVQVMNRTVGRGA